MNQRWDALYLQILGAIHQGAPILIATFLLSLLDVSIYAIFNLVILGLNSLLGIFMTGLTSGFGDLIARGEREPFKKAFGEFEFIYTITITIIYSTCFLCFSLSFPFIPEVVISVITIHSLLSLWLGMDLPIILRIPSACSSFLLENIRRPGCLLLFRGLSSSLAALSLPWGLNGIILGSILSNVYRDIEFLFFAPRHLTHMPVGHTVKLWTVNTFFIILASLVSIFFPLPEMGNYLRWIIFSAFICIFCAIAAISINALLFPHLACSTAARLIHMVKRSH